MTEQEESTPAAWDQIPGEPPIQYQAFQHYRESGITRSKAHTAREVRAGYATVIEWAKIWFWDDRCDDFDKAQARARDAEYAKINVERAARWAKQQAIINDLSAEITINELRELQKRGIGGGVMTPAELARFMKETQHQGNLAAGKPTDRIDTHVDLSKLSEEDRSALEQLRPALEQIAKSGQ